MAENTQHARSLGLEASLTGIDPAVMHTYMNGVVMRLHRGLENLLQAAPGITLVRGRGHLVGPLEVSVGDQTWIGRNLVLATGSTTKSLPGIAVGGRILGSTEALALPEIPQSVTIIGGSVIVVEFASAWRFLGAEVTIIEALPRLVSTEDPTLSKNLERAFRRRKIGIRTNTKVATATSSPNHVTVTIENGETVVSDYVLLAVGRTPRTEGQELGKFGIDLDNGWIATDDRLRTSVENIYTVGDLVRGPQLAHRGFAHGISSQSRSAEPIPHPLWTQLSPGYLL